MFKRVLNAYVSVNDVMARKMVCVAPGYPIELRATDAASNTLHTVAVRSLSACALVMNYLLASFICGAPACQLLPVCLSVWSASPSLIPTVHFRLPSEMQHRQQS